MRQAGLVWKNVPELSERGRKEQVKVGNSFAMEGGNILHNK